MNRLMIFVIVVLFVAILILLKNKESFNALTEADTNMGSFLQVEKAVYDPKDWTFLNLDEQASDNLFPRTRQTVPLHPTEQQVEQKFNQCMKEQRDTVNGCLTYAQVGLYPYMCKKLAGNIYGEINNYTGLLCNKLMLQQRTSCAAGPC